MERNKPAEELLYLVDNAIGAAEDNLYRANLAFKGMTPGVMKVTQYGKSGKTCQEIVDGYESRKQECIDAKQLLLHFFDEKGWQVNNGKVYTQEGE